MVPLLLLLLLPKPPGLFFDLEDRTGRRPLCTGLITTPSRSLLPHDDDDLDDGESDEDDEDEDEEYDKAATAPAEEEEECG